MNLYRDIATTHGLPRRRRTPASRRRTHHRVVSAGRDASLRPRPQERRGARAGRLSSLLASGSLLVARGQTQALYRHGVPKEPAVLGPRINLTFRKIPPASQISDKADAKTPASRCHSLALAVAAGPAQTRQQNGSRARASCRSRFSGKQAPIHPSQLPHSFDAAYIHE